MKTKTGSHIYMYKADDFCLCSKAMFIRQGQDPTFVFIKLTTFVRQEFSTSSLDKDRITHLYL
jgi:hypothetical protein